MRQTGHLHTHAGTLLRQAVQTSLVGVEGRISLYLGWDKNPAVVVHIAVDGHNLNLVDSRKEVAADDGKVRLAGLLVGSKDWT